MRRDHAHASRPQYDLMGFRNEMHGTFRVRRYLEGKHHPLHTDTYHIGKKTLIATAMLYLTSPEQGA